MKPAWFAALLVLAVEPGQAATVTLDGPMLAAGDIGFAAVQRVTERQEIAAYGTVLAPGPLADAARDAAATQADSQAAAVRLTGSAAAFARAKKLYAADQNISKSELQAAETAYLADQAALGAAAARAEAAQIQLRQGWGPVLATAVERHDPLAQAILAGDRRLLTVAVPAGSGVDPPPDKGFADGGRIALSFVSTAAQADPRLPGAVWLMSAAADPMLLPGATLPVRLQDQREISAALVPEAAVIRWQGEDWIYVATDAKTVERRRIATDRPARGALGFLVGDLAPDARIVVRGAQLVLSEEFKALARAGDND